VGGEKGGCLRERNTLFDIQNRWCVVRIMAVVIPVFPHVQLYLLSKKKEKVYACFELPYDTGAE